MMLNQLNDTSLLEQSRRLKRRQSQFNLLIDELNKKEIPEELLNSFNEMIDDLNKQHSTAKLLSINIRRTQSKMLKTLEKELKLVPKHHYRNTWMAIGMSAFGLPMGVVFGSAMGNMAFIGIGLPIGMAIGIAYGDQLDKKAAKEGRQLDIQIEL
jgi:hypothetical protein